MKRKVVLMIVLIMLLQIVFPAMTIVWETDLTIKSIAAETTVNGVVWEYTANSVSKTATDLKPKDGSNLKGEIIIPSTLNGYTVTSIAEYAFNGFHEINIINVPSTIREIKYGAFSCIGLKEIKVDQNNKNFTTKEGILFTNDMKTIVCYPAGITKKEYVMPNTVTTIVDGAFLLSSNLEHITISKNIKVIGKAAFMYCYKIEKLRIPEGVTTIETLAFAGCDNLKTIIIPASVTNIGGAQNPELVFADCSNLTIYGKIGSCAETYANENSILFKNLEGVLSITISQAPNKTNYIEGQNFNPEGMKIKAKYSGSISEEVEGYTITDGNNLAVGKTSVTISYTEYGTTKTVAQGITVVKKALSGIEISQVPTKTSYIEGQNFNTEGMKVIAKYDNGTSKEVTNYTVTDGNNLALGKKSVTISYTEDGITKTAEQAITVAKKTLTAIEISEGAKNTSYIEGQNFNTEGMKVIAKYDNGTSKEVTNYTVTDGNNLSIGKTSVTISYTEDGITKTAVQNITVVAKSLVKIELKTTDVKLEYTSKERLNTEGLVIIAIYDNGTAEEIKEGFECTPVELNEAGEKTITVTYGGKTATYTVKVTLRGDVDGNNKIDFMDILLINKHRLSKKQLEGINLKAADVTDDGKIDFMDMMKINKYRLGKINSL